MRPFMDEHFLLDTPTAQELYERYAKPLPLIDYHCHISPQEIYEDRRFDNLTELWLGGRLPEGGVAGDHYKWRLMRANGEAEETVTGSAPPYDRFMAFVRALELAIGNPMYHWCHLELKSCFGITEPLTVESAPRIWETCQKALKENPKLSARGLIKAFNVRMIGTTDDPADDLVWHERLAADDSFDVLVYPSFRPDRAVNLHKPGFAEYIARLGESVGRTLHSAEDVGQALIERLDYFAERQCRASDHGLDAAVFRSLPQEDIEAAFRKAMKGEPLSTEEIEGYQTYLLVLLGRAYAERDIVMQIHYSCLRNTNARALAELGPDAGYDSVNIHPDSIRALAEFLSELDKDGHCPKTILYSLNPADNIALAVLTGAFQGPETPGKIQHGSAWWFNDSLLGMENHLRSLASVGLLGNFVGMLTDSRSFLSYTRHDYFRRIFCRLVGRWVEEGEFPKDERLLKRIVEGVCGKNAARCFGLDKE